MSDKNDVQKAGEGVIPLLILRLSTCIQYITGLLELKIAPKINNLNH